MDGVPQTAQFPRRILNFQAALNLILLFLRSWYTYLNAMNIMAAQISAVRDCGKNINYCK